MDKLIYNKSIGNLELSLNETADLYEILIWFSDGSFDTLAYWDYNLKNKSWANLVFCDSGVFQQNVDKDIFWQLAEEGQFMIDAHIEKVLEFYAV